MAFRVECLGFRVSGSGEGFLRVARGFIELKGLYRAWALELLGLGGLWRCDGCMKSTNMGVCEN